MESGDGRNLPFPATANKGPAPVQPIDLARLAEQTGGDRMLEREVLTLFLDDATVQIVRLAAAVETGQGDVDALAAAVDVARQYIVAYLAKPE